MRHSPSDLCVFCGQGFGGLAVWRSERFQHLAGYLGPQAWPVGSVVGLRARGGLTVDVAWAAGALTRATLRAPTPVTVPVRCGAVVKPVTLAAGETRALDAAFFR